MDMAVVATEQTRTLLAIDGMTCAGCASKIESSLAGVEGVESAGVNFGTRTVLVSHRDDLAPQQLAKVITGLGYQVTSQQPARQLAEARRTEAGSGAVDAGVSGAGAAGADAAGADVADPSAADPAERRALIRWVVSAPLALFTMLISMVEQLQFSGWRWALAGAATIVVWWGGWGFLTTAWVRLKHRTTAMDSLISLAALSAWSWSVAILLSGSTAGAAETGGGAGGGESTVFFDAASVIVAVVLVGRWLETRSLAKSGDAVTRLATLISGRARLATGEDVDISALKVGDEFLVRPGERIATDAVVIQGHASIDTAAITGESLPLEVAEGDEVMGGTLNVSGSLVVSALTVSNENTLAKILETLRIAQASRAPVQRMADRVSAVFVPGALAVAAIALIGWLLTGAEFQDAGLAAVAVLVVACPCALGLATPIALVVGTSQATRMGVLVKSVTVLEQTRRVNTVLFDKTGTLTEGQMHVTSMVVPAAAAAESHNGAAESLELELLALAAETESRSEHPIGAAIVAYAQQQQPLTAASTQAATPPATSITYQPGFGAIAEFDLPGSAHTQVLVGRPELFDVVPDAVAEASVQAQRNGNTAVLVGRNGRAEAVIGVGDRIKPSAAPTIAQLRASGMRVGMLSGDSKLTANHIAEKLGIDANEVQAELTPAEKLAHIEQLQAQGRKVAMVGDGINDAPALAKADVSIAVGTGSDIAQDSSALTLVGGDLSVIPASIALSRRILKTIQQNLGWAFAYNTAAIPLAAFGIVRPVWGAIATACSSLLVVNNSLRLRRFTNKRQ